MENPMGRLHEWLVFSMENVGTVNIPYMDAMGDIKLLTFGRIFERKNVGIHYPIYLPYEQSHIIRLLRA